MVIISQNKDKTTESLEFNIEEIETCKNIFISKDEWKKYKKIIQKDTSNNEMTLKDMKGLGEFLDKDMTKIVYTIIEVKERRIFGIYTIKEKAKQILQEIVEKSEKQKVFQVPEDDSLEVKIR